MERPWPIRRAILAIDGSEHARAALAMAGALAWQPEATIWVTCVVDVPSPSEVAVGRMAAKGVADWRRVLELSHYDARDRAQGYVAEAAAELRQRHPAVVVEEVVRLGGPAAELVGLVEEVNADLIVAGARGQTVFQGVLLGSVSEALAAEAPCPALIVRRAPPAVATVLAAVRSPEDADLLAGACLRLPLPPEARVVAVTVSAPLPQARPARDPFAARRLDVLLHEWAEEDSTEAEAVGRRFVERIRAATPDRHVEAQVVRGELNLTPLDVRGDIAPTLLRQADVLDASLLVVGARERRGLTRRLGLGSVSRRLVRHAPSAVLVVRA
jgi:nucleotide-binding universal stress UspA family protein